MIIIRFQKRNLHYFVVPLVALAAIVSLLLEDKYIGVYISNASNSKRNEAKPNTTTTSSSNSSSSNFSASSSSSSFDPKDCPHQLPPIQGYEGKIIWIPGYPGSGNEMSRSLVTAITGVDAADVYGNGNCLQGQVVTCKTHWPSIHPFGTGPLERWFQRSGKFDSKFILLVRNPKDAIPSFCNVLKGKKLSHTDGRKEQALEDEWNDWRDKNFAKELNNWKNLIWRWSHQLSNMTMSLLLPYEHLIDSMKGPILTQRLAEELNRVSSVGDLVEPPHDKIPCIWYSVVKWGGGKDVNKTKRAPHKYIPGYRRQHKDLFVQTLQDLKDELIGSAVLGQLLDHYTKDIQDNLRIIDD